MIEYLEYTDTEVCMPRSKYPKEPKVSKKHQKAIEKENEVFNQKLIKDEDDPRLVEAMQRVDNITMDEIYRERKLTNAMQEVIEASPKGKYSVVERMQAVMAYATTGSVRVAARITGVSKTTIHYWKQRASWWPIALEYAKSMMREEVSAKLGEIQHKAMEAALEGLEEGDEVINLRTGETYRKKVSAKDAMAIAGAAQDKRAILNGEATKITETRTQDKILDKISKQLESLAKHADQKVIEGIVIEKDGTTRK